MGLANYGKSEETKERATFIWFQLVIGEDCFELQSVGRAGGFQVVEISYWWQAEGDCCCWGKLRRYLPSSCWLREYEVSSVWELSNHGFLIPFWIRFHLFIYINANKQNTYTLYYIEYVYHLFVLFENLWGKKYTFQT